MKKDKKEKKKIVYYEDKGETVYSMAALVGKTPEQLEEEDKKRKNFPRVTGKENWAMIKAAFTVYGPVFLMLIGSFAIAAVLLYFFLK